MNAPAYKLEAVSVAMTELEAAWQRKHDAGEDFKTLCGATAAAAGLEPAALKAYVNAKMQDKLEDQQKKCEQLSLLVDELE